ncbi:MAG: HprK-related kinase A, partial [Gammaproteobacteria bacterium]
MKVSALSPVELAERLKQGMVLRTGPVSVRIHSSLPAIVQGIATLYADYPLASEDAFIDFHIRLARPGGVRRWLRPQVAFFIDGHSPFKPLPLSQAFPMLEWGLNWCMASYLNHHVILHAAVVERGGLAVILPGAPGAGKSTLCAALAGHGWRLFSDEMAIVDLDSGRLIPNPRPIGLKNDSIDIIRHFLPEAVIGAPCVDTRKGTVAHMRAPRDSVERAAEVAPAAWVIAPRYQPGGRGELQQESRARMLMELVGNAFNYSVVGARAFQALSELMEACDCYRFEYEDLNQALAV